MRDFFVRKLFCCCALAAASAVCQTAQAVPILQLYVEGGTYVGGSEETWEATSTTGTFRIWAIGNVDGAGGKGSILAVKLSAVYDSIYTPTITLTGSQVNSLDFPGVTDPTAASNPGAPFISASGAIPQLGDGSSLPTHGEYGAGRTFQEFALGDFTESTSSLADFTTAFPTTFTSGGQINVYNVTITGLPTGATVHFDLYDHILATNGFKYKFAPFSHDAEEGFNIVPEPAAFTLVSLGALGTVIVGRRRRQSAS